MFVGTGSDVGKSVINTAFCRIFLQDGFHPAPFKAQNMSLNSYATPEGLEIGRAQAVQAEACGIPCHVDMNPVLLKPNHHTSSQVVLLGKPIGNQSAYEYYQESDRTALFKTVLDCCHRLMEKHHPVVIEGAGSISEINLWEKDITNMRVAQALNAPTYLVADIDRGGVFGSVYGSILLLPPEQRKLIKGIIINKFRGDKTLFETGKKTMETLTGIPVVGIVPHFEDIFIEQEDSVALEYSNRKPTTNKIRIAVIRLLHLSNFTDFNLLAQHPNVDLFYSDKAEDIASADILLLPGSKNTIDDLNHLYKSGLSQVIQEAHQSGTPVYGICGGYQMMGKSIHDPFGVEGTPSRVTGLCLLPVHTTITQKKKTKQCSFFFLRNKDVCNGYEIHMGETVGEIHRPLCQKTDGETDGFFLNDKTFGTYIHGFFDNEETIKYVLNQIRKGTKVKTNYHQFKENQYEKLAAFVREHVHLDFIYQTLRHD